MTRPSSTERDSGLSAIADDDGVFAIIAMDQRNTLRRMFEAPDGSPTRPT
jgi:tagatose-1,6-bisphosphate aldolase